ncbi:MAG: anaerobic C4-dicarboxylate transporter [Bacteroidota bacterium]|nr:anaerobic C4-dicarboxylate transporter [Bacteroidota bacterium]
MTFSMIIQLLIVLAALYVGSRYGSLALGAISGIGLGILVFGFGLKPGTPPTDVIYIIIAAITCAGMLQASGGMDWLIQLAEKLLRKHQDHITFLAPLTTFFLTVLVGTGHVVYTLMPIICDISLKKGIRPERPCGVASIASQVGITCSPIAAAVVSFVAISNANGYPITIPQVLMVTIPSCVIGLLCAAAASYKRGKDLDKDPEFLARKNDPELYKYMYGESSTTLDKVIDKKAKGAVYIFLGALVLIVLSAVIGDSFLPRYKSVKALDEPVAAVVINAPSITEKQIKDAKKHEGITISAADVYAAATAPVAVDDTTFVQAEVKPVMIKAEKLVKSGTAIEGTTKTVEKPLAMNLLIQILMLVAAASMIIFCKASPKKAVAGAVWQSGMVAVVAIYGIAWLADTYFGNYMDQMKEMLGGIVEAYPWSIAFVFFLVSVLINSQGAVVVAMLPLAYELGIAGPVLLGVLPSVYGYFFIPNYPSDIATVNFDRSGTTKIGKYLLNHSFMMPGLISVIVSTVVAFLITNVFFASYFAM